ncbi:hypothetical protein OESDEN_07304 [Oesophagostomum dentatum]|uniref:Uncharacterized protein n=1 Tax=Oesophagostomum dentatum TaxID=61180 RepID=A0A0B1T6D3_OESDE|nr:hypothetical protein OESDEN_07304 [Oesophagostomum dentatum]
MDKYLDRMFDSIVDRGPDFAFTLGSLDHVLMQEEDRVVIEEVMTHNNYHEESIPREVAAPPNFLEIETEEPVPNDDEVVVEPLRHGERREPSPSVSASPEIPAAPKQV